MNKIGLASVAVMALTAVASADYRSDNFIDGGEARLMGSFTGAQLAAMRGVTNRATSLYSTNWTTDSNGATFTAGNIGGQGGWLTYAASGAGTNPSNYKINAGSPPGRTGQAFQITGPTNTTARYAYQDVSAQWAARNAGDNICWVEYDAFLSSAASTSGNRTGGFLYAQNAAGTAGGMATGMLMEYGTSGTSTKQRSVFGLAYYANGTTLGNFRFKLSEQALSGGGTSPLAVSGGWTNYAMSFNQNTGEVNWFYSVDNGANYTGFFVMGAATGMDVLEWDFYASNGAGSTSANSIFGDFEVYATPAPGAAALVGLAGLMARRRRA
jgi:hypothetical protein